MLSNRSERSIKEKHYVCWLLRLIRLVLFVCSIVTLSAGSDHFTRGLKSIRGFQCNKQAHLVMNINRRLHNNTFARPCDKFNRTNRVRPSRASKVNRQQTTENREQANEKEETSKRTNEQLIRIHTREDDHFIDVRVAPRDIISRTMLLLTHQTTALKMPGIYIKRPDYRG